MVVVGLPKGIVKSKSLNVIKNIIGKNIDKRKLNFYNDTFHFALLKHRDIPRLVHESLLDFGITSSEWLMESGYNLEVTKELDWCDTRVSLISKIGSPIFNKKNIKCITEFPRIASKFFRSMDKTYVKIEHISGSSEALVPMLFDCCIDCVETGTTLKLHNLSEEKVIYESKVVIVVRQNPSENLIDVINNFILKGRVN